MSSRTTSTTRAAHTPAGRAPRSARALQADSERSTRTLRDEQAASFGHLLITCAREFDEAAQARLNASLGDQLARPAVMRLIPWIDTAGIRPTELARRVDVSKQAVGQVLADLEARGLVEYVPDPHDGRARLVRMTRAGVTASRRGLAVLAELEREVSRRVGRRALQQVRVGLAAIQVAVEQSRTRTSGARKRQPPTDAQGDGRRKRAV